MKVLVNLRWFQCGSFSQLTHRKLIGKCYKAGDRYSCWVELK